MKTSISKVVLPSPDGFSLRSRFGFGGPRLNFGDVDLIPMLCQLMRRGKKYRVTYTLNRRGRYKVFAAGDSDFFNVTYVRAGSVAFPVCFLPKSWIGKRVSREIKFLET